MPSRNESLESKKRLPSVPNVVVLGCGMGGFTVSRLVSKQVGSSAVVTVIEPRVLLPFPPAFQWIVFGWRQPEKILLDPIGLSKRKNVRVVRDKVEKIDIKGRTVKTQSQTISYDKL